jgi:hypothetical protein
MVIEVFDDDGEAVTPEQKAAFAAAFEAMMFGTGVVKLSHTKDGKVEIGHIPIHDMFQPPKDPQ